MEQDSRVRRKRKNKKKTSFGKKLFLGCFGMGVLLFAVAGIVGFFAWRDIRSTTDDMYADIEQDAHASREAPIVVDDGEDPFSVLVLGVDTEEGEGGRSDTMMVMTVNPNTDQMSIVSIPRDTYTEIIGQDTMDKINHAYALGGTSMSVNTVQNLFDIPIDYYVSVNMESMPQIVDAVGGIDVVPPLTFSQGNYTFTEGESTRMDGSMALEYSRMRGSDPDGDYGRQGRQRQVLEGTVQRIASFDSIMNYRDILGTMGNNMQTNMTFDDMYDMFSNYRGAVDNIDQVQMSGYGETMDGVYYEMIPDEEINRVSDHLKTELEID